MHTHTKDIRTSGKAVEEAEKALILIHGRGGSAADMLSIASHLKVHGFSLLAPQATNNTWYPNSFLAPTQQNEPGLSSALEVLAGLEKDLNGRGFTSDKIYFLGFSQGACLTLEYVSRHAKKYGGVVAFTGGLIGDTLQQENYQGDFKSTPIFIGSSDPDPHVPVERVLATEKQLLQQHADATVKIYKNMGHTISQDEIDMANGLIFSR